MHTVNKYKFKKYNICTFMFYLSNPMYMFHVSLLYYSCVLLHTLPDTCTVVSAHVHTCSIVVPVCTFNVVNVVHYMSLYMKSSYTSIHIHMYLLHVPATCSTVPGTCSTSDTGKKLQARFELPIYF